MEQWHLFCKVVDNLGDAGVLWRLARELAAEYDVEVTLWIDDLATFSRIEPRQQAGSACGALDGVAIGHWDDATGAVPAAVVVAGFGFDPPAGYVAAMTRRHPAPVWIHLEYLSAEAWVDEFHGRPSPQAHTPLTKYFFFPGFSRASGGLLRESGLLARRAAWCADGAGQRALWERLGIAPPLPEQSRLSLFAYANAGATSLLACLASGQLGRWSVLVPEGVLSREIGAFLGGDLPGPRAVARRGALELCHIPFLDQCGYDELLWGCDVNFVRGEDSFVRAQWAGRGFVWQAYPQSEGTHHVKVRAFLERYLENWPPGEAARLRTLWFAWNGMTGDTGAAFAAWWAARDAWRVPAGSWGEDLAAQTDLCQRLVNFSRNVLK